MDSVSNSKDHERTLRGERQARLRSIEARARSLLDLADPHTLLSDDGADQDVGNEQAKWVGLGLWRGRLLERLLVECANDETKGLGVISQVKCRMRE